MRKRKSQKHAALTNNQTPTESLPDSPEIPKQSNQNRQTKGENNG